MSMNDANCSHAISRQCILTTQLCYKCRVNAGLSMNKCVCMQVLGCAKGVLATVVSVLLFRNQVTALGALGYSLTVVGVFAYSWAKRSAAKQ